MSENVCIVYHHIRKRTIIYKTLTDEDIVFVDQIRLEDDWTTKSHMMLSKQTLKYAEEFSREVPQPDILIEPTEPMRAYVQHTTLPEALKVLLFKYDVQSAPFCDNQLANVEQTESLLAYWGLETHYFSPLSPIRYDEEEGDQLVALCETKTATPVKTTCDGGELCTPKTKPVETDDDESTPVPSRCWAPKKRRLSEENPEHKRPKFLRLSSGVGDSFQEQTPEK